MEIRSIVELRFANEIEFNGKGNSKSPVAYEDGIFKKCQEKEYIFNGFIMPWVGRSTKLSLTCKRHGEWHSMTAHKFLLADEDRGCPKCSKENYTKLRSTGYSDAIAIIKSKLKDTNVEFVGFKGVYKGNASKLVLKCKTHNIEWDTCTLKSLMAQKTPVRCSECLVEMTRELYGIPFDVAIKNIHSKCEELNYTFKGFVSGYVNTRSKLHLCCNEHGTEWKTTSYDKFMAGRSGCHLCKPTGYKTSRPGHIYIQKISGVCNAIKFGITNLSPEERMKQQQRKSILNHEMMFCWEFDDGRMAYLIENEIKRRFKGVVGVVPKELMDDGFTETLPIEILPNFLKDVKSLCNEVQHGLIS